MDLVEIRLASDDEIVMLDRKQVVRLLAEKQYVLDGTVAAEDVAQAGKLLSVELFAVVEASETSAGPLTCVVYDATTSVRLCDQSVAAGDPEAVVIEIVSCIQRAVKKRLSTVNHI